MSVTTKAKGCPVLEKTKEWFTNHFQEDWNEDLWKSIGLADLVKEGLGLSYFSTSARKS
jgi:hypothetical protein